MQQAWAGIMLENLSIKAGRERPGTSAQGQGDQPLALPFSLGLLAIFCCLSWRPAWSRDLGVSSLPCPLGLRGHCPGRKEGVADQKVQRKAAGVRSWVALARCLSCGLAPGASAVK